MNKLLRILLFLLIYEIGSLSSVAKENKILFKINNEIITSIDIKNEMKYLGIINLDYSKLDNRRAIEIAKKSLIKEKIKKTELNKRLTNLNLADEILNQFLINYFKKFGINTLSDFNDFFLNHSLNPDLIREKVNLEILWNQFIYQKYIKKVKIDKERLEKEILKNKIQKEFLLAEILFTLNNDEKLDDKFNKIKKDITESSFSKAALNHSISSTSNQGGELGWIKEAVLSEKIRKELNNTNIGNYTNPIVIPGGFLILNIKDQREFEKNLNFNDELKLLVDEKTNKQLNQFSNIYFNKLKQNTIINEL